MKLNTASDVCEELAIEWQCQAIVELNRLLKTHNIQCRDTREDILSNFFFALASDFDGAPVQGMSHEGRTFRPRLVFVEETGDERIIHMSDSYDLHDYAHSDVFNVLDEDEEDESE